MAKPEKRESRRVFRELTPAEAARLKKAREETERDKDEIMAIARKAKARSRRNPKPFNLGERLRALRSARQMTQQAVAEAASATTLAGHLGVTVGGLQASLSQIESGAVVNPGILTVDVLCRGLGVSISELLEN